MAVPSNTFQRAGKVGVRESLHDTISNISPTKTPFTSNIGSGSAKQTHEEWLTDSLGSADADNKNIEGDDATNDASPDAVRFGNHTQLFDKVASVSSTAEAVTSAGNYTKMSYQLLKKFKEIKLDLEKRACSAKAAVPADGSTAGEMSGMVAMIRTNVDRGSGGAASTLSQATKGYVSAAPTNGTTRIPTEDMLKNAIQLAWSEGGEPSMALMSGPLKQVFSGFSGIADLRKDVGGKKATIVGAADVYVSDFGDISLVPARYTTGRDVSIIDPSLWELLWLQKWGTEPLAKTGLADRKQVSGEVTLKCANEKGNAGMADLKAA